MFLLPCSILASVNDPVAESWVKPLSEFNAKYSGGIDYFSIHANPCNHPERKQAFFGKILSVSFIS